MPDEAQLAASKVGVDAELEYWRPRYARLGRILVGGTCVAACGPQKIAFRILTCYSPPQFSSFL